MLTIDAHSRTPIYEQIKNQITELIRVGVFKPGEQLPSIRAAAGDAGLNVNTVKRAFLDLEADGVIYTLPGRGSFVSENALGSERLRCKALGDVEQAMRAAKTKGIEMSSILEVLTTVYGGKKND